MDRRTFVKLSSVGAAATAMGCANTPDELKPSTTTVGAASAPATATTLSGPPRDVKLGFIALTDAAPLAVAKENGFFAKRNLNVSVEKQASWPALRDALLNDQIDGAHCLYSMPFSVATGIGGTGSRHLKIAMGLNQNGQAITLGKEFAAVGYGDLAKAGAALKGKGAPVLGQTFPGGTHDIWLRYWIKACGVDATTLTINPVPPPQMVQNMSVGSIQGYCVGEPWNAVAVQQGIGFTHLATQDLWEHHPEKALVFNETFVNTKRDVAKEVMAAVLEACMWLDDPANRSTAADLIGTPTYVNAPAAEIRGRLTGTYDLGAGLGQKVFSGNQMRFFREGNVNAPRSAYGIWFLAQFQRLGLLKTPPPYKELTDSLILKDLYAEVAASMAVPVPSDDMSPFIVKLDNTTFDPNKPDLEVARA